MVSICFGLLMTLLKTAILLEWIRIFVPHRTRNVFYWSSVTLMLINGGFYVGSIIGILSACRPFEKLWHFWVPGTCNDQTFPRNVMSAVFNLVMDTFVLILPQRVIWTLQMIPKRRAEVSMVFSVGLLYVCPRLPSVALVHKMRSDTDVLSNPASLRWPLAVYMQA